MINTNILISSAPSDIPGLAVAPALGGSPNPAEPNGDSDRRAKISLVNLIQEF
jgi:hypothetical protein